MVPPSNGDRALSEQHAHSMKFSPNFQRTLFIRKASQFMLKLEYIAGKVLLTFEIGAGVRETFHFEYINQSFNEQMRQKMNKARLYGK